MKKPEALPRSTQLMNGTGDPPSTILASTSPESPGRKQAKFDMPVDELERIYSAELNEIVEKRFLARQAPIFLSTQKHLLPQRSYLRAFCGAKFLKRPGVDEYWFGQLDALLKDEKVCAECRAVLAEFGSAASYSERIARAKAHRENAARLDELAAGANGAKA